jgi:hypothetical protein
MKSGAALRSPLWPIPTKPAPADLRLLNGVVKDVRPGRTQVVLGSRERLVTRQKVRRVTERRWCVFWGKGNALSDNCPRSAYT